MDEKRLDDTAQTDNSIREVASPPPGVAPGNNRKIKLNWLINILLFAGLLVLYGLYFLAPKETEVPRDELRSLESRISENIASIVYVSSDKLLESYELAIKMREDFEQEQARLESDLTRRQRNFQSDVESFQRSVNAGTISLDRAQAREQELMQMQQEIMQLNETYMDRLARMEFEMNTELLDKISDFLERYNREMGHDFILGYTRGGGILFADPSHDITDIVLDKLNAEYQSGR